MVSEDLKKRILEATCPKCQEKFKKAWEGGEKVKELCGSCRQGVTTVLTTEAIKRTAKELG